MQPQYRTSGFTPPAKDDLISGLFRLSRPKQWVKNVYLFAPLVFSGEMSNPTALLHAFYGFLLFCLASTSVYIINDIADVQKDRLHPKKKFRPLASKQVPILTAWFFFAGLVVSWLVTSLVWDRRLAGILLGYAVLNVLYSIILKNVFLVDVLIVSMGFVLRTFAGAVVVGTYVSPWIFVCTILVSLFLALAKRRNELFTLQQSGHEHRPVLSFYSLDLTDQLLTIVCATTIMAYSLYTFYATGSHWMMATIPFVIYGLFRYLYLVRCLDLGGAPEEALLGDAPTIINILLWGGTVLVLLYGRGLWPALR